MQNLNSYNDIMSASVLIEAVLNRPQIESDKEVSESLNKVAAQLSYVLWLLDMAE